MEHSLSGRGNGALQLYHRRTAEERSWIETGAAEPVFVGQSL